MAGITCATEGSLNHLLCHFQANSTWFTGLVVSNLNKTRQAEVNVKAYDRTGSLLSQAFVVVPPLGKSSRMVSDPTFLNLQTSQGWIEVESNTQTVALLVYKNRLAQGMAALPSGKPSSFLVFPHFHCNASWWTGLAVVNPHETATTTRISAVANHGSMVDVALVEVPARGQLLAFVDHLLSLGTTESGWLLVEGDPLPVAGLVVYGNRLTTPSRIAAVSNATAATQSYISDFRSGSGWWTGISLVNPSPTLHAIVDLEAWSSTGSLLDQRTLWLSPLEKQSGLASGLFSLGFSQSGWVGISSNIPVAALQTLSAGPPEPTVSGLAGMIAQVKGSVLHYPHYDVGSVWWTLFALLNPNDTLLDVQARGYATDGSLTGSQNLQIPAHLNLRSDPKTLLR